MVIHNMRQARPAYNLISNNCQTFAVAMLDAIQTGSHQDFATTFAIYQRATGHGSIKDLFTDPPEAQTDSPHPGIQHQNTVQYAQQVMEEHTTKLDDHCCWDVCSFEQGQCLNLWLFLLGQRWWVLIWDFEFNSGWCVALSCCHEYGWLSLNVFRLVYYILAYPIVIASKFMLINLKMIDVPNTLSRWMAVSLDTHRILATCTETAQLNLLDFDRTVSTCVGIS